ncbi:UDP-glycosyltransferase 87A2-like [Rhododendron vialii]|uniref:UDP-glycosyltransferase 87A2-like n=1 Tax=Rhododendron vialii TaxID=182163 RepID=UPI002660087F|nr:UDP-glycosyltransferase 87A2-like [Rhododendron vialii]
MNWLNSQCEASVLYVSLGSFLSTSEDQMKELSLGLRASGTRYLWIVRADQESSFRVGCCEENGFMVPWCDQLRVLCHRSIGGFLTHCGWNSTMESIFAGVPMLTFALCLDQMHNSKIIVEDLGVGMTLKGVVGLENVIGREEIAETVKRFMDLDGKESKEMRRRAKELQEICHRAIDTSGSTEANVTDFVESLCCVTS